MFSYFEPNFIEKFPWESGFQLLAKMIKIGYLAAILKPYNIFNFLLQNCDFYSPYIYGATFIAKFLWESGFLKVGSMEPPLGTNGSKSTLVT